MTRSEKAKVRKLMKSRPGLVQESCAAAGFSRVTYYNIMRGESQNIDTLNRIIEKAKEIIETDVKIVVAI